MNKSQIPTFKILPLVQIDNTHNEIDIQSIRALCSKGLSINCPPEDRALAWLNLLSIYPANPQHWSTVCKAISKSYHNISINFSVDQFLDTYKVNDKKLMDSIKSDIDRSILQLNYLVNKDGSCCKSEDDEKQLEMHMKRIERILYVFAKVNPKFGYIQGFNELLIPIYYVMNSAHMIFFNHIDYIEAFSYEAFQFLLISSNLVDFFTLTSGSLQNEDKLHKFDELLNHFLPKIYKKLKLLNIESMQYSYKWFNIMFSQEHSLPQLLPLWDSILAHLDNLTHYEFCIGVARIRSVQDKLESNQLDHKHHCKNCNHLGQILSILCNIETKNVYELIYHANLIFNNKRRLSKSKFSIHIFKDSAIL